MGPLEGIRIVELAGIGPVPMCSMLLADLGADIVRVDRVEPSELGVALEPKFHVLNRSRRSIAVDLKQPKGIEVVLRLVEKADALVEGFRPGVTDRLGLGPDVCQARNPRLVYGRMTGWGQTGPLAHAAGHDTNYIALTGALWSMGRSDERPPLPLNVVGDYGGGALYLALGVLAGILDARRTGRGQVVDAAMVDGAASLISMIYGMRAMGLWKDERGANLLDTGAPFAEVYETKDGKFVSVCSIEPKFYAVLLKGMGLDPKDLPGQYDRAQWPATKERFAAVFKTKTRDEWDAILLGTDACYAPVLSIDEAPHHPHNRERGVFVEIEGVVQPAPAPRFDRTPGRVQRPPARPGEHTDEALRDWGFAEAELAALRTAKAIQ